mgnify:FL=1
MDLKITMLLNTKKWDCILMAKNKVFSCTMMESQQHFAYIVKIITCNLYKSMGVKF